MSPRPASIRELGVDLDEIRSFSRSVSFDENMKFEVLSSSWGPDGYVQRLPGAYHLNYLTLAVLMSETIFYRAEASVISTRMRVMVRRSNIYCRFGDHIASSAK